LAILIFHAEAHLLMFFFLDKKEPKNQGCSEMTKICWKNATTNDAPITGSI
jgi:hypothetical protein